MTSVAADTPERARRAEQTAQAPAARPSVAELDARIADAERRLMDREARVQRGFALLGLRTRDMLRPSRLAVPVVGGIAAVAALVWWLRPTARPLAPAAGGPLPAVQPRLPWVRAVGLMWPLLPDRWRHRVSPATASAVAAIGLPLLERTLARRKAPPLPTMVAVDLDRLAGTWHEIARLPQPFERRRDGHAMWRYTPRDDGFIAVTRRETDPDGRAHDQTMLLRPVAGGRGARLQSTRWPEPLHLLPAAWSNDHWILHVDNDYREALVGSPARDALVLLSRRCQLPVDRQQALLQMALDRGFDIDALDFSGRA